jgi:hypothetical protein
VYEDCKVLPEVDGQRIHALVRVSIGHLREKLFEELDYIYLNIQ